MTASPYAPTVMDVLRGERESRPPLNTAAAARIRATLETAFLPLSGLDPARPTLIRAASFAPSATGSNDLARLRGLLVTQTLRLLATGYPPSDAFVDAVTAWRAGVGTNELTELLDHLEPDEVERLSSEVTAHALTLARRLGELPTGWFPRTAVRAAPRLAGGRVVLLDVVDLMVGTDTPAAAGVVLLDVTTGALDERRERVARYHALVHTLRTGVAPLRSAVLSTATGDLWTLDGTDDVLDRAADDLIAVVEGALR